jgi:septal ring factor EnvC (AmiA/AmiB activator)
VFCAIALHFSVFAEEIGAEEIGAEEIGAEEADANGTAKQLQSTIERLNALDEWFSEAEKKRAVWLVELQRQDRDISHLNVEVERTATLLRTTQNELVELKTEVETTESLKKTQATRIATHIAAAYRLTGQDFLKQLLNQESPDTLDRMMRYHRFFSTSRLEVMVAYRETLIILATLNVELESQQETQQTRRQALETEKQGLSEERVTRSGLISQLDSEKETRGQEYDRLKQDRVRLENLLTELRRRSTELDGSAFKTAACHRSNQTRIWQHEGRQSASLARHRH